MANREEIIMDFDEQANPVIEVKGVKGRGCKALTADIEKALGTVKRDTPTREMFQTEETQNVRGKARLRG